MSDTIVSSEDVRPIRRCEQLAVNSCGAACAEMVLEQIGTATTDQLALLRQIQAQHPDAEPPGVWGSGPRSLTETLNDLSPDEFLFYLRKEDSEQELAQRVVWTLFNYRVAPIVLTDGGAHWVVVYDCDVSREPSRLRDNGYEVVGFYLRDPAPVGATPSPTCSLEMDSMVPYDEWLEEHALPYDDDPYPGLFLAICNSKLPVEDESEESSARSTADRRSEPPIKASMREASNPDLPADTGWQEKTLIPPEAAQQKALEGIKQYRLNDRKSWNRALEGAKPDKPLLVRQLHRPASPYYIVPFRRQLGTQVSTVLVSVSARKGSLRQSVADPTGTISLSEQFDFRYLIEQLNDKETELPIGKEQLPALEAVLKASPPLVWRPCAESFSPFRPFYLVNIEGRDLYVRIDGKIFTKLTTKVRGF